MTKTSKNSKPKSSSRNSSTNQLYALSYRVLDLMDNSLADLLRNCDAKCALIIDRTGCIMASTGDFTGMEPSNMAATGAATIAALNTFAPGKGVHEASVDFHHDEADFIYFLTVENRLSLCIVYKHDNHDELRKSCRLFADEIKREIQEDKEKIITGKSDIQESVNYIESKLDELFKDHPF